MAARSVLAATRAEIDAMPEQVRAGGLAASALTLAGQMRDASPRDMASLARELRATLSELRELAAAAPREADPLDEITKRRAARLAGADVPERSSGAGGGGPRRGGSGGQRRPGAGSSPG